MPVSTPTTRFALDQITPGIRGWGGNLNATMVKIDEALFKDTGAYVEGAAYAPNDLFQYGGSTYRVLAAVAVAPADPSVDAANFRVLAAKGADGIVGGDGADGASFLTGEGVPAAGLGADGDAYLDRLTGDLYAKAAGAWAATGQSLLGPEGPAGADGTNGTDGVDGASFLAGEGVPAAGLGADGDLYLNLLNGDVYAKAAGNWATTGQNLKGPQGPAGNDGADGADGSDANVTQVNVEAALGGRNVASGFAGLDTNGLLDPSVLPAKAITDVFVVADETEMLALVAQVGDHARRTDEGGRTYILRVEPASVLANWVDIGQQVPSDAVQSVNGRVGAVNLGLPFAALFGTGDIAGLSALAFADYAVNAGGARTVKKLVLSSSNTPGAGNGDLQVTVRKTADGVTFTALETMTLTSNGGLAFTALSGLNHALADGEVLVVTVVSAPAEIEDFRLEAYDA